MQIEITGEIEELIRAELASGRYRTPEECIEAMARNWEGVTMTHRTPQVPKDIDIDVLAEQQGVQVIRDAAELKADFWPEGESVDDFVSEIRKLRSEESPRFR